MLNLTNLNVIFTSYYNENKTRWYFFFYNNLNNLFWNTKFIIYSKIVYFDGIKLS